jgi:hypothetical protein
VDALAEADDARVGAARVEALSAIFLEVERSVR